MIRQSQTFLCIDKNQGLTEYIQFSNLKVKFISKNHCVSYALTFSLRLKKKTQVQFYIFQENTINTFGACCS